MTEVSKQAEEMSKENGLEPEVNQAYIDNVGAEYAKAEDAEEAYSGDFDSDEAFAENMAEECGDVPQAGSSQWPLYCIDWEYAARELMYDYFEVDGHYFRNL